jgi:hypothetical protein
LAPLEKYSPPDFHNFSSILKKIAPQIKLIEEPLDDTQAQKIKSAYKIHKAVPKYAILYGMKTTAEEKTFLINLAEAINKYFGTAKVISTAKIDHNDSWETFLKAPELTHLLIPQTLLNPFEKLHAFYQENPKQKKRYLANVPVLALPDISMYLQNPLLKRSLWNVLCHLLN